MATPASSILIRFSKKKKKKKNCPVTVLRCAIVALGLLVSFYLFFLGGRGGEELLIKSIFSPEK